MQFSSPLGINLAAIDGAVQSNRLRDLQMKEFAAKDQQRTQLAELVKTLPPDQQVFARLDPETYVKSQLAALIPDPDKQYKAVGDRLVDMRAPGGPKIVIDGKATDGFFGAGGAGGGAVGGGAPAPSGPSGPKEPLGIRNNNPGNIRVSDTAWDGKVAGGEGGFERFSTLDHGVAATAQNLLTYADKHGLDTIEGIVGRWAPPNENNTAAYVANVSKLTGLDPKQPLDLRNPAVLSGLTKAIIQIENGRPVDDAVIGRAVQSRLDGTPLPTQVADAGTVASDGGSGGAGPTQPAGQPERWVRGFGQYKGFEAPLVNGKPDITRLRPVVEPTNEIREYEYAKGQGYKGTFAEYQQDQKRQVQRSVQPVWYTDESGGTRIGTIGSDGTFMPVQMPQGSTLAPGVDRVDLGTSWGIVDKRTGMITQQIPKDVAGEAAAKERGEVAGKLDAEAPKVLRQSETMLYQIDNVLTDPALSMGTGMTSIINSVPGTRYYDFGQRVAQLQGQAFLQAFETLRGGGAITELEGQKATQAIARLSTGQTEEGFRAALGELRGIVEAARQRAASRLQPQGRPQGGQSGAAAMPAPAPQRPPAPAAAPALPPGFEIIGE